MLSENAVFASASEVDLTFARTYPRARKANVKSYFTRIPYLLVVL
jgi:hypothetical protein